MTNKEQEKIEFDELYAYVKTNILNYPNDMALPKHFVMRLKGLRNGQFYANNKQKTKASYSYSTILLTFKFCKVDILNALNSKRFTSEQNKINYIMAIIENKINDIALKLKAKEKSEQKMVKIKIVDYENKVNKNKSSIETVNSLDDNDNTFNSLINDLW